MGTEFILLPEKITTKKKKKTPEKKYETTVFNTVNIWQKRDSESWNTGNKEEKPYDCLSLLPWREFPSHGTGKGNWSEALQ